MTQKISFKENGRPKALRVDRSKPPLYALRNELPVKDRRFGRVLAQCANAALIRSLALAGVLGAAGVSPASAQDCPGPMRLVVGYPPGGGLDNVGRILAERMTARTGRTVVVENKPGMDGAIAAAQVARAPSDGCTLIIRGSEHHMLTLLRLNPGYAVKDFAPAARVATQSLMLVASPQAPFKDVATLVAYAKAHPGKVSYGATAVGGSSHMAVAMFTRVTGADMVLVQYKGNTQALVDTAAGVLPLASSSVGAAMPLIAAGKLVPLVVSSSTRWPGLPNVPTVAEAGYPDATIAYWTGIFAPAATPLAVRETINREVQGILQEPAVRAKLLQQGIEPVTGSLADFDKYLQDDLRTYSKVVRELELKPE